MTVATTILEGNLPFHDVALSGMKFVFTAFDDQEAPRATLALTKWARDPENIEPLYEAVMGDGSTELPVDFTLVHELMGEVLKDLDLADIVDASPIEVYAVGAGTKHATYIVSIGVTTSEVEDGNDSDSDDWG